MCFERSKWNNTNVGNKIFDCLLGRVMKQKWPVGPTSKSAMRLENKVNTHVVTRPSYSWKWAGERSGSLVCVRADPSMWRGGDTRPTELPSGDSGQSVNNEHTAIFWSGSTRSRETTDVADPFLSKDTSLKETHKKVCSIISRRFIMLFVVYLTMLPLSETFRDYCIQKYM
jgi:hypothetical protein